MPKIQAGKRLLDENAATQPCESQWGLQHPLSPHLDAC